MRVLGLDYGDKTIGVALSDPAGRVALRAGTLRRPSAESLRRNLRYLAGLAAEQKVEQIVLGYPLHMDGSPSARSVATLAFKDRLARHIPRVPIALWDERLSTAAVQTGLNGWEKVRDTTADERAAAYILQGYLDRLNREAAMSEPIDRTEAEDDDIITLTDEDGREIDYRVLASKTVEERVYLLAEVCADTDADGGEAVHFKSVESDDEEIVFEMVDGDDPKLPEILALFKDEYEAHGIEIEVEEPQ